MNKKTKQELYSWQYFSQSTIILSPFAENQLIAVVFDLFAAGGESVSNTISFGLLYMILYPEVQKKAQEEIDRIIGNNQVSVVDRQR